MIDRITGENYDQPDEFPECVPTSSRPERHATERRRWTCAVGEELAMRQKPCDTCRTSGADIRERPEAILSAWRK